MKKAIQEVISKYYELQKTNCNSHTCNRTEAKQGRLRLDNAIKFLEDQLKNKEEDTHSEGLRRTDD